jgi:hypothetical protein
MNWKGVTEESTSPLEPAVLFQAGPQRKVRFKPSCFRSSHFESSHSRGLFEAFNAPRVLAQMPTGSCPAAWTGETDLPPEPGDRAIRRTGERVLR